MPLVRIDGRQLRDWDSFHETFADTFGFPSYYGRNLDAWIDCMTYLEDPSAGMTKIHGTENDPVVLQIDQIDSVPDEIYRPLVECAAFVNYRRIEQGQRAIIALSYFRNK